MNWIVRVLAFVFFKYILTPENIRAWVSILLEMLNDYVLGTKSDIDDKLILPAIDVLKESFNL